MTIDKPTTIESLVALATDDVDEWMEEHDAAPPPEVIEGIADDNTPSMTSVLFKLVVLNNSLAFEKADVISSEPFTILYATVRAHIADALHDHVSIITGAGD